jgi:hypothetical protein
VGSQQQGADDNDHAVEEEFEALVIAKVEPCHCDVPAQSNNDANTKNKDASGILRVMTLICLIRLTHTWGLSMVK